jgi:alkanesulfonate monooxygenase SsuD/methylene tetrahydromethanopterin reductase-like flavin-dependent oxidoreductase (luciferase family)
VQELYLAGRHRDAAAAVPVDLIDQTSLLGPPERVAKRLTAFADAGVTTLAVALFTSDPEAGAATLRTVADAAALRG